MAAWAKVEGEQGRRECLPPGACLPLSRRAQSMHRQELELLQSLFRIPPLC